MSHIFKNGKALFLYGACTLGVAFLCTVLRLLCMFFFFDKSIGYYTSGAVLPVITNILPVLAVIAALVFCFVPKLKISPIPAYDTQYTKYSSVLPAVGFAAFAVIYAMDLKTYSDMGFTIPFSYILCVLCAVGACAFFALRAFRKSNSDIISVLCGVLTIIWLVLSLAECYFDSFVQMNSPIKLIFQFACLSGMLLIINEMRVGIDTNRTSFHLFSATVACILLPMSAIPSLIAFFTNNISANYALLYEDIVLLLISVYAVCRFVQMCFGKVPPEPVTEITETAEETNDAEKDQSASEEASGIAENTQQD